MCEIMDKLEEMYYKVGHEDGQAKGREVGREEGIINLIVSLKELNISKEETSEKLRDKYNLKNERIDDYMSLYWK